MIRRRLPALLGAGLAIALVAWIASNTYWAETKVPTPLGGEARTNPFYAAQRFAEGLGARTQWDRVFITPPADALVVLSGWHWNLSDGRRQRLQQWVESGGRLVTDRSLVGRETSFTEWTGVEWNYPTGEDLTAERLEALRSTPCHQLRAGAGARDSGPDMYWVCGIGGLTSLAAARTPEWALSNDKGLQVVRVGVGRGSVTVINTVPFTYREFLQGDHARLFVAATQLRRGDVVHFLNEDDHPSLVTLVWLYGWPSVALGLALTALALWRGAMRSGPLDAPPDRARRSLAEQLQGIGRFTMRFGGGEALHAAAVRALRESAARRIRGYAGLPLDEQASAVARLAGCDEAALGRALATGVPRRPPDLRAALGLIEQARRGLDHAGARRRAPRFTT